MPKVDVIDEGVINASPMEVYKAVLDEYAGVTHWWLPVLELKPRGDMPICEGAICDISAHGSGATAKFSCKLVKLVEAKSIEVEYSGNFLGTGKWTFEPIGAKTKVQYHFNVQTNRLLFSLASPFMSMGKPHSEAMQAGFKSLNSYLGEK